MPVLGGLAFLITIGINILMHVDFDFNAFIIALIGAIGIFAIGIYDDKKKFKCLDKNTFAGLINFIIVYK